MANALFRQTALDRLSSPEQLDEILSITGARLWLSLIAVIAVLGAAVFWSIWGLIPTKITGQGVITRVGGVLNVVSSGAGMVESLPIAVGDHVKVGQVVATVAQPELLQLQSTDAERVQGLERERDRVAKETQAASLLELTSVDRDRDNTLREIDETERQAQLARQQAEVQEQLAQRGLITRQQVIIAQQFVIQLQDAIAHKRAHLVDLQAQRYQVQQRPLTAYAEAQAKVEEAKRTLSTVEHNLPRYQNVESPFDGEVIEVTSRPGALMQMGVPVVSLQSAKDDLEMLAFVPAALAKNIHKGMAAEVVPSTIKREQYGFLRGEVLYVGDYPASPEALMRDLQNENLMRSLTADGPVTEIRTKLLKASTPSGLSWSSRLGPPAGITSGTLCSIQVITKREAPISLLFPYLSRSTK